MGRTRLLKNCDVHSFAQETSLPENKPNTEIQIFVIYNDEKNKEKPVNKMSAK
jgi:hypothetical protein